MRVRTGVSFTVGALTAFAVAAGVGGAAPAGVGSAPEASQHDTTNWDSARDRREPIRNPLPTGPMSILYAESHEVSSLTSPGGVGMALSGARGVFRQDPGPGGIFDPNGRNDDFRLSKVSSRDFAALSAEGIAAFLMRESDSPRIPNNTGLVTVDEIGNSFNDGRIRVKYKVVDVRGKKMRIAAHNNIVLTKRGWKLVRGRAPLPPISPDSLGSRFSAAMEILAATPHAAGGSYADRVHVYIAPAFASAIGVGRGPERHLGNDGKPQRATWRAVMPGIARAGGVWLEMYHFDGGSVGPMSAQLWRKIPGGFTGYLRRYGGDRTKVHFLLSGTNRSPVGAPAGCANAMSCQWDLARATAAGRAVLANGVGVYRPGSMTRTFRQEFNRSLP
ncbi:MAG TPA: hypothetical protein PKE32_02790 [Miltoncostaeaceae bacterium]|nr:hypothetical protein [Miltoncostaeaceae bacterium]